jgi:hypothetical protein
MRRGGGESRAEATATPTPTPTATETATPEPSKPARTDQECFELWNTHEELGTAGQTAPADYLADLAPTPAAVVFASGECLVIAPIRGRRNRASLWVAPRAAGPVRPSQSAGRGRAGLQRPRPQGRQARARRLSVPPSSEGAFLLKPRAVAGLGDFGTIRCVAPLRTLERPPSGEKCTERSGPPPSMPGWTFARRTNRGGPRDRPCDVPSVDPQSDRCRSCTGATAGGDDSGVRTVAGVVAPTPFRIRTVPGRERSHHPPEVVINR